MMTYIFNAMTNLAIDIRLMAFKFFDLVVQFYPPCFSLYAEKVHELNHVINYYNYYIWFLAFKNNKLVKEFIYSTEKVAFCIVH